MPILIIKKMKIDDIYPKGRQRHYKKHLMELEENKEYSKQNKEDFKDFCIALLSTGETKQYRAGKVLHQLKRISLIIKNDLRTANLKNIQELLVEINNLNLSDATRADYRRSLKQFFYWFEDEDLRLLNENINIRKEAMKIYKYLSKHVSTKYKKTKIQASDVISNEDVKIVTDKGCKTIQDKAIIQLLHETGMRTSEITLTKIKNFNVDERGIGTITTGASKTDIRTIDIIKSVPFIQDHIKQHINKNEPEARLFYYIDEISNKIKPMTQARFYRTIKKIFKLSEIKKKHNPHWWRHSRSSLDEISGLPIMVRKRRMGWTNESKMISNYTHLGRKEEKEAWLRNNGIEIDEKKKEEYIHCICRRIINSTLSYCPHCGRPTSLEVVDSEKIKAKELQIQANELLTLIPSNGKLKREHVNVIKYVMEMMNNPELMKKFEKYKKIHS